MYLGPRDFNVAIIIIYPIFIKFVPGRRGHSVWFLAPT